MTETTERSPWTIIGIIMGIGLFLLLAGVFLIQRGLGAITESKQSEELTKLLGGIKNVCGNSNHPEVNDLYVTVFEGHQIRYERGQPSNFGGDKGNNVKESGCNQNCLCAFNGDEVVQCVSMYSQESPNCQDINIQEDHIIDSDLDIPAFNYFPLSGLPRFPDANCKFQFKLKWDGSSNPKRVVVEKKSVQTLSYTRAASDWSVAGCDF